MENYLAEAFQKLSLLKEDDFDITADRDVVDELKSFVADDVEEIPEEPVIDVDAESEEDLADNYVGKVILECACCHTRIYKDEAEVVVDEESGLANIEEACPVCNNVMGYTVIGKIEKFDEEEPEAEDDVIDFSDAENDPAPEAPVESLKDRLRKKRTALKEGKDVCPNCGKNPCECDKEPLEEGAGLAGAALGAVVGNLTKLGTGKGAILGAVTGKALEMLSNSKLASNVKDALEGQLKKGQWEELRNVTCPNCGKDGTLLKKKKSSDILCDYCGQSYKLDNQDLKKSKSFAEAYDLTEFFGEPLTESFEKQLSRSLIKEGFGATISAILADPAKMAALSTLLGMTIDAIKQLEETELAKLLRDWLRNLSKAKGETKAAPKTESLKEDLDPEVRCQDCAYLVEGEDGSWICDIDGADIHTITECPVGNTGSEFDESLNEGIENLSMDTDDTHVEMNSTPDGGATVTVEPKMSDEFPPDDADALGPGFESGEEEIVPLSDEEQEEILANEPEGEETDLEFEEEPLGDEELLADEEPLEGEEEVGEEEEEEELPEESLKTTGKPVNEDLDAEDDGIDIDEFDEDKFNDLCESYLRKVYENVNTFNTTAIQDLGNKLIVEGTILFKNNKQMKSKFVFTEANETKSGKVVLAGYNETFSKQPKSFKLKGTLKDNHYVAESMAYRYTVKNLNEGKTEKTKVLGKVKTKK